MTSSAVTPQENAATADHYVRVQQFYARQVRHLDTMNSEDFAATFTEDGVFYHAPGTAALEGRQTIANEMREYQRIRYADDPCQRRHWFNMLQVFPQEDGTILTEYYALVLLTRPGLPVPEITQSSFVTDVIVLEDGQPRVRERKVMPDHTV